MTTNKGVNALTILDGMIDGLCRDVPDGVLNEALFEKSLLIRLLGSSQVDGCLEELLGASLVPTSKPNSFRVHLGPNGSHALKLARAGLEVLYDSLGPKIHEFNTMTQLSAYRRMAAWPLQDFVACAKYWVSYPMARMLRGDHLPLTTDLPPRPPKSFLPSEAELPFLGFGSSLLYTGSLKRLLKNRLTSFTRRNLSLALSLLQGVKRGCEQVPPSFIHATMLKHRATLTRPSRYDWGYFLEFSQYFERFYSGTSRVHPHLLEPSTSASFDAVRSEGGAREFLRKTLSGVPLDYPLPAERELLKMYEYRPGDVREIRGEPSPSLHDVLGEVFSRGILFPPDPHEGRGHVPRGDYQTSLAWHLDYEHAQASAAATILEAERILAETTPEDQDPLPPAGWPLNETFPPPNNRGVRVDPPIHNSVMVSGVLEPLKVRLITKGESWKYWISRFYQRHIWQDLQRHPQFSATGRPVDIADFHSLLDRETRIGLTNMEFWVSGDYSAATDNVKIDYTKLCFETSLRSTRCSGDLASLLRSVVYEQELHYPASEHIDPVTQGNGQLMGSTLSFPVLCAINLVAYWSALEAYLGRDVALDDLPVMVNGDDILFRSDARLYGLWLERVNEMGFQLSLGKNYLHERFFTINSQGFLASRRGDTWDIQEIPFLNVGLLLGQSKVTARLAVRLRPIWDFYNEVLAGATSPARAHRRFLHYHRETIDQLTQGGQYNLFIDPMFGGLGFRLLPDVADHGSSTGGPVEFTAFQRRFGGFLKSRSNNRFEGEFKNFPLWRGLVSTKRTNVPRLLKYHRGTYISQQRMRPLMVDEVLADDPSKTLLLPLAVTRLTGEQPGLVVRKPDRKVLRAFRASHPIAVRPRNLLRNTNWIIEKLQGSDLLSDDDLSYLTEAVTDRDTFLELEREYQADDGL